MLNKKFKNNIDNRNRFRIHTQVVSKLISKKMFGYLELLMTSSTAYKVKNFCNLNITGKIASLREALYLQIKSNVVGSSLSHNYATSITLAYLQRE